MESSEVGLMLRYFSLAFVQIERAIVGDESAATSNRFSHMSWQSKHCLMGQPVVELQVV